VPFLVLELLDGETLASRLARGPLPIDEALRDAIDIADALAAAHGQGIVHRDLKPSNVMMTRAGVKLLDFGLAQLLSPQAPSDVLHSAPSDTTLTRTGMVIGTLPYMSPEQIEGRKADARSDVFSFGSLLYEMLTGRQAFAADPNRSAAAQILSHDPIPMTQLVPAVPAGVEKIVAHCLRKDPGRRYQDIADVKVALEDVREESRGASLRRTSRAGSRRAWMLLPVAAALIAAYFGWMPRGSPESIPPPRLVPITTLSGTEATPTLAPDGDHVAFAWSGTNQDNFDIYVQRIGSGSEQRRTFHPERDFSPAWSPDNQWIAFIRGGAPVRAR
jgi:eukaryotic-like serine/threonine-protein kinase